MAIADGKLVAHARRSVVIDKVFIFSCKQSTLYRLIINKGREDERQRES